jgi:ABC-type Zn uptake system ZnuABC Zn-binding protein ZnuA
MTHEHVGDGVYVENDGWGFNIRVNDHRSTPVVFLDPEVAIKLVKFIEEQLKKNKEGHDEEDG